MNKILFLLLGSASFGPLLAADTFYPGANYPNYTDAQSGPVFRPLENGQQGKSYNHPSFTDYGNAAAEWGSGPIYRPAEKGHVKGAIPQDYRRPLPMPISDYFRGGNSYGLGSQYPAPVDPIFRPGSEGLPGYSSGPRSNPYSPLSRSPASPYPQLLSYPTPILPQSTYPAQIAYPPAAPPSASRYARPAKYPNYAHPPADFAQDYRAPSATPSLMRSMTRNEAASPSPRQNVAPAAPWRPQRSASTDWPKTERSAPRQHQPITPRASSAETAFRPWTNDEQREMGITATPTRTSAEPQYQSSQWQISDDGLPPAVRDWQMDNGFGDDTLGRSFDQIKARDHSDRRMREAAAAFAKRMSDQFSQPPSDLPLPGLTQDQGIPAPSLAKSMGAYERPQLEEIPPPPAALAAPALPIATPAFARWPAEAESLGQDWSISVTPIITPYTDWSQTAPAEEPATPPKMQTTAEPIANEPVATTPLLETAPEQIDTPEPPPEVSTPPVEEAEPKPEAEAALPERAVVEKAPIPHTEEIPATGSGRPEVLNTQPLEPEPLPKATLPPLVDGTQDKAERSSAFMVPMSDADPLNDDNKDENAN